MLRTALVWRTLLLLILSGCGPSARSLSPTEQAQADYLARRRSWRVALFEREQENLLRSDRYASLFARLVPNEENLWRNEGKKPAEAHHSVQNVAPTLPPPRT